MAPLTAQSGAAMAFGGCRAGWNAVQCKRFSSTPIGRIPRISSTSGDIAPASPDRRQDEKHHAFV